MRSKIALILTLAMALSAPVTAMAQHFNPVTSTEFVDPTTFTKPYEVKQVVVDADETTGQPRLEARTKSIIEADGLKFKDLNGNGQLDVYEDWRQDVDARVADLLSQMTMDEKAGALLFACLAAYAYKKWRHSWIAAFVFMLLSEGSYAAYISMTLCLFFLCSLKELLFDQEANDKHNLVRHFGMLFLFGGSMVATTVICNLITANNTAGRVQDAQAQAATDYIDNIITSVQQVFAFFLPGTSNSYFHGERVMYSLFLLCAALSAVLVVWLLVKQQLWKRPLGLFLLVADIVCLPLAMNVIGIVSKWVHTLMTFAYLTPWLFFVMAVEQLYRREDLRKDWEKLLRWGYSLLACVVAGLTVLFGIRLANICYTKAYARYTEGLADSIRLTNLIEAIPNYVKGETPVAFVGVSDNHFPRQDAYELTSDIAGIGDLYYWQGMYTAPFVLDSYVNQHLRANMLIFPQDAAIFTADTIADQLNDAGINASADEIKELLQDLHAFPKEDCWTWYNDVLLIKLFAN